jgi:fumarate hydratase class II
MGAQIRGSNTKFPIGSECFLWGLPVIRASSILKESAALANGELSQLLKETVDPTARAAQEVVKGRWSGESPAKISVTAYDVSLRGAVLKLGLLTAEQFDLWVRA